MTLFSAVGQVQMQLERKRKRSHIYTVQSLDFSSVTSTEKHFTTVRNFSKLTLWHWNAQCDCSSAKFKVLFKNSHN